MMNSAYVKHRFMRRGLAAALAAGLVTSIVSCGGGGGSDTGAVPSTTSTALPPASTSGTALLPPAAPAVATAVAAAKTSAALDEFWGRYGAKTSFDKDWVELLTKLLDAEDKVVAEDFKGARVIVDELIKKYPLMENNQPEANAWWVNYNKMQLKNPRPHFGEPGMYAHLRMLDDITKMGVSKTMLGKTTLRMAVVMPACTDIVPEQGPTLINERLNPEIEANDFAVLRQSLRLFQSYLLAISGGELRLELKFYKIEKCFQIKPETRYLGGNFDEPLLQLPKGEAEKTDMFWLVYPNQYDKGAKISFSSGISLFNGKDKPVFMCEDDWVLKKRAPDQGSGSRTEVERRMYLPEWFQHEFFHHMFASWPELKLEGTKNHEYHDKAFWPADFTGQIEEDYYSESLRKRFYSQPISIAQKLKRASN